MTTDFTAAREAMVDCQVRPSDVTRYPIIEAMLHVPRERFVPKGLRDIAYAGTEIPLGEGRAMLEPRILAKMLEAAAVTPDDLVLDVAPGTGYSTAVLARMAEAVVAVEPDRALAAEAQRLLPRLEIDNATVTQAPAVEGDPAHGPYDAILINGAVQQIPTSLTGQLAEGGRLVAIFADGPAGRCRLLTRAGDAISDRELFDATAPLLAGFERPREFTF